MTSLQKVEATLQSLIRQVANLKLELAAKATPCRLIFFDLETTGLGKTAEIRICEIGAVDYQSGETFQRYVNPLVHVHKGASEIHKLKKDFLQLQPDWGIIGHAWHDHLRHPGDVIIAGFNSKRYDSRILMFENTRHGIEVPSQLYTVDLREVFKILYPSCTKTSLQGYFQHCCDRDEVPDAHTAVGDAKALFDLTTQVSNQEHLWKLIHEKKESWESVRKRCFK